MTPLTNIYEDIIRTSGSKDNEQAYSLHSVQRCKLKHPPEHISGQSQLVIRNVGFVGLVSQVVLQNDGLQGIRIQLKFFIIDT